MTASDFTNLHLQYKSAQADGEVPAVIEHDFPGGRMVDHYFVTPSPAFWADEGVKSLDSVSATTPLIPVYYPCIFPLFIPKGGNFWSLCDLLHTPDPGGRRSLFLYLRD